MNKNNRTMWVVFGAAMVLSVASGVFVGCDHGSNIPIYPEATCVELVTDECVPEVIAEFCEDCETCETCETCEVCETCETCPVVIECEVCEVCPAPCYEPPFCDSYDETTPRGHLPKECRGNGK